MLPIVAPAGETALSSITGGSAQSKPQCVNNAMSTRASAVFDCIVAKMEDTMWLSKGGSVIEQELLAIDDAPDQVLVSFSNLVRFLLQVGRGGLDLFGRWNARKGTKI